MFTLGPFPSAETPIPEVYETLLADLSKCIKILGKESVLSI